MTTAPSPIRNGYTIIEMIAVIVIISTIASVVGSIVSRASAMYADASSQREEQERQSFALERMVRAIRETAPLVGSTGTPGLVTGEASRCIFEDGTTFELSGTDLLMTPPGGVAGVLARDVSTFSLTYVGEDGSTALNFGAGDTVDMTRTIRVHLQSGDTDTHTVVYLRAALGAP